MMVKFEISFFSDKIDDNNACGSVDVEEALDNEMIHGRIRDGKTNYLEMERK